MPGLAGGPWDWEIVCSGAPLAASPDALVTVSVAVGGGAACSGRRGPASRRPAGVGAVRRSVVAVTPSSSPPGSGPDGSPRRALDGLPLLRAERSSAVRTRRALALPAAAAPPVRRGARSARSGAARRLARRLVSGLLTAAFSWRDAVHGLLRPGLAGRSDLRLPGDRPGLARLGRRPRADAGPDVPAERAVGSRPPPTTGSRRVSRRRGPAADRSATSELRMLDETGRLRPAVVRARVVLDGPGPDCGWAVGDTGTTVRRLRRAALPSASGPRSCNYVGRRRRVGPPSPLGAGEPVRAPVSRRHRHASYVRMSGHGQALRGRRRPRRHGPVRQPRRRRQRPPSPDRLRTGGQRPGRYRCSSKGVTLRR